MTGRPLSLAPTTVLELDPSAAVRCAADAGFPLAGARLSNPLKQARTLTAALRGTGVGLLDVEFLRLSRGPLTDDQRRLAVAAGDLGARFLIVVGDDPDDGALQGKLADLADLLAGGPTRLALEPRPYTAVPRLADAARLATAVPGVTVLMDPVHLHRAGDPLDAPATVDPALVGYAQVSDVLDSGAPDGRAGLAHEALQLRVPPGQGNLALSTYLTALPVDCPLSVNVQSTRLSAELRPVARAALVREATETVLSGALTPTATASGASAHRAAP